MTSQRTVFTRRALVALACATPLALAACGGSSSNPLSSSSSGASGSTGASGASSGSGSGSSSTGSGSGSSSTGSGSGGSVVVGAADFSESQILAQLYAGALKAKGVNASVSDPIGSRETYLKALTDGSIQVMPEYTGALALFYKKDFAETDAAKVYDALKTVIPSTMTVLDASKAEDNDSISVTKETADSKHLTKVSDLAAVAKDMTLAAPPEFMTRAQGVPGLAKVYGITFGKTLPLKGQAVAQALKNGQADAANIFTTDPAIAANGFVVLQDDKKIFGSQNVVPLVAKTAVTPALTEALNGVQAKLTTDGLRQLISKVDVDHQDASTVAKEWLAANNLG